MSWAFSLCYMFDHLIQWKWTGSILTTTFTTRKDRKDLSEWYTGKKQSQENRGNEKARDWELLLHLSLWKTLRVTWKLLLAWNLHITTSVLIITFCNGKQFLFSSEFRQRVYLITAFNGAIPHLQHKMCNKRLVSNGNVNSSLPQTTQIWCFKVGCFVENS